MRSPIFEKMTFENRIFFSRSFCHLWVWIIVLNMRIIAAPVIGHGNHLPFSKKRTENLRKYWNINSVLKKRRWHSLRFEFAVSFRAKFLQLKATRLRLKSALKTTVGVPSFVLLLKEFVFLGFRLVTLADKYSQKNAGFEYVQVPNIVIHYVTFMRFCNIASLSNLKT